MEVSFGLIYAFFIKYLIPFIFAIGLIMLLYGSINYFIIGPGEEPKRDEGRQQLLWAFILFLTGLLFYAAVIGAIALASFATSLGQDVDTGKETRFQDVPNVPLIND